MKSAMTNQPLIVRGLVGAATVVNLVAFVALLLEQTVFRHVGLKPRMQEMQTRVNHIKSVLADDLEYGMKLHQRIKMSAVLPQYCRSTYAEGEPSEDWMALDLDYCKEAPMFLDTPRSRRVLNNQTASFTCLAWGIPSPSVEWSVNGSLAGGGSEFREIEVPGGSILRIEHVQGNSTFECVASNAAGDPISAKVTLEVLPDDSNKLPHGFPTFLTEPEEMSSNIGLPVLLVCDAIGDPEPNIKWFKEHVPVDLSNQRVSVLSSGNLQISNSTAEDIGKYECVAENKVGSAFSRLINLHIRSAAEPLMFVETPRSQRVLNNQTASFTCLAKGVPPPSVEWIISSYLVGSNMLRKIKVPGGSILRIQQVQASESYQCVASNAAGEAITAMASLKVLPDDGNKLPHGFPTFLTEPGEKNTTIGLPVLLMCDAIGDPEPNIRWFKEHVPVDLSNPRISVLSSGSLQISNSTTEDTGQYECVAENSVGSAFSRLINIYIRDAPEPFMFVETPRSQRVLNNQTASFTCLAKGFPPPSVEWIINAYRVGSNMLRKIKVPGGSILRIQQVQDSESYQCVASNAAGEAITAMASLEVLPYDSNKLPHGFPTFLTEPGEKNTTIGLPVLLMCNAIGDPEPNITWFKEHVPVDISNPRISVLSSGSLQISNSTTEDTGQYECVAENSVGSAFSRLINLYIRDAEEDAAK